MIRTSAQSDDDYVSVFDVARAHCWDEHDEATELTLRRLSQRRTTSSSSLTFIPQDLENDLRARHVGFAVIVATLRLSTKSETWKERWLVADGLSREEAQRLVQQLDQSVVVVEPVPGSTDRILLVDRDVDTDVGQYSTELFTTTLAASRGASHCWLLAQPGSVIESMAVAGMRREMALVRELLDR